MPANGTDLHRLEQTIHYIAFHRVKSCEDLANGERKIEVFLTYLAVDEKAYYGTTPIYCYALSLVSLVILYDKNDANLKQKWYP